MANDDVGPVALIALQLAGRHGHAQPGTCGGFPIFRQPIGLRPWLVMRTVADGSDPRKHQSGALGEETDLMAALLDQPGDQLSVLAGHVLMDKKKFHERGSVVWGLDPGRCVAPMLAGECPRAQDAAWLGGLSGGLGLAQGKGACKTVASAACF